MAAFYYGPNDKFSFTQKLDHIGLYADRSPLLDIVLKELCDEQGWEHYIEILTREPFGPMLRDHMWFAGILRFFNIIKTLFYGPDLHDSTLGHYVRGSNFKSAWSHLHEPNTANALCEIAAKWTDARRKDAAKGWIFKTDDWARLGPIVMASYILGDR